MFWFWSLGLQGLVCSGMSVAYQICAAFLGIGEENEAEVYFLEIKRCILFGIPKILIRKRPLCPY